MKHPNFPTDARRHRPAVLAPVLATAFLFACGGGGVSVGTSLEDDTTFEDPVAVHVQLDSDETAKANLRNPESRATGKLTATTIISAHFTGTGIFFPAPASFACEDFSTLTEDETVELEDIEEEFARTTTDETSQRPMNHLERGKPLTPAGETSQAVAPSCKEGERQLELRGPFRWNLETGLAEPPVKELILPVGTYTAITLATAAGNSAALEFVVDYQYSSTETIGLAISAPVPEAMEVVANKGLGMGPKNNPDFLATIPADSALAAMGNSNLVKQCLQRLAPLPTTGNAVISSQSPAPCDRIAESVGSDFARDLTLRPGPPGSR